MAVRVCVAEDEADVQRGCVLEHWCGTQEGDARTTSGMSSVNGLVIFTL